MKFVFEIKVAVVGLIMVVVLGLPNGADACEIMALERTILVTNLQPLVEGNLCFTLNSTWICYQTKASINGSIVYLSPSEVSGLAWFESATPAPKLSSNENSCVVAATNSLPNPLFQEFLSIITPAVVFFTGLGAAWWPMSNAQRSRSRELKSDWIGEYQTRLREFVEDSRIDIYPRPIPHLQEKERRKLRWIIDHANSSLASAGYLKALEENERKKLVEGILTWMV